MKFYECYFFCNFRSFALMAVFTGLINKLRLSNNTYINATDE